MVDLWSYYFTIMGSAVGIAAAYAALLYFGSSLLGRKDFEKRAKHEIIQVVITLFLVPALFLSLGGVFDWLAQDIDGVGHAAVCSGASLPPGGCYFQVAKNTLGEFMREEVWLMTQSLVANNLLQFFNSIAVEEKMFLGKEGGPSIVKTHPYGGLSNVQSVELHKVDEWAYRSFQITAIMYAFFNYVENAFPILLGVGLILRLFPIARKIGGLLIAIALGTYYILPLPIVVAGDVYHHIPAVEVGPDASGNPIYMRIAKIRVGGLGSNAYSESLEMGALRAYSAWNIANSEAVVRSREEAQHSLSEYEQAKEEWGGLVGDVIRGLMQVGASLLNRVMDLYHFVETVYDFITGFSSFVIFNYLQMISQDKYFYRYYFEIANNFILISLFTFYVGVISTIGFIKQFSPMLGGDVEIGGLTHLV